MDIKVKDNTFFIFDLDDTLFLEIDYLKSGFLRISSLLKERVGFEVYDQLLLQYLKGHDAFKWLLATFDSQLLNIDLDWLLKQYREHFPSIALIPDVTAFLKKITEWEIPIGLITDGRSITQRNKIKALGIDGLFKDIIISEEFGSSKPDAKNYLYFQNRYPGSEFYFFGDNTSKDFIVPINLGWKTVCLKSKGLHIHKQDFTKERLPDNIILSFKEVQLV